MTQLRGLSDGLEAATMDHLGDEITYTPEGESPRTFNCWVEFDTDRFGSPGSAATKATPQIEVRMADVPAPKTNTDRITIALRPGQIFTPADVRDGPTGETWVLPLKKVPA